MSSDKDATPVKEVTVRDFAPAPQIDDAAFGVDIYLDGEFAGHAANTGRGGPHRYEFQSAGERERFFAYAQAWGSERGIAVEAADELVNHLCDEFEYTEGARELVSKGAATVVLIEKGPHWFTDDHDRDPDLYTTTYLVGVPAGQSPEDAARGQNADRWRVITTD